MKNIAANHLRCITWLIDSLISLSLFLGSLWIIFGAVNLFSILNNLLTVFICFLFIKGLAWPLLNLVLISNFGGSIGKLITGISIVDSNNQFISFKRAFFRNIIGYMVSSSLLFLGFIWILVDKEKRGWHDLIADTYVIVKNKGSIIWGILSVIILLGCNVYLIAQIFTQINQNNFPKIFQEVRLELQSSPNPNSPYNSAIYSPLPTVCIDKTTKRSMIYSEARQIAEESGCIYQGNLTDAYYCNNESGTWWINLDIQKDGCNPACVVNVNNRTAEINWRCTGLKPI